jgi:dihydrofolate reductase
MAKLFFGLNQSLDGYVDYLEFATGPALFRHFYEQVRDLAGSVYGRRVYEVMRIWDEDRPEWAPEQRDFAAAWRRQPKWVVSRSLKSVGRNATLVEGDIEAVIRGLKAQLVGEIQVAGPDIARSLTDLGLIDEYRLYFRPVVLGRGKPFFAGPRPPLRLVANDRIGEDAIRLTYVPANHATRPTDCADASGPLWVIHVILTCHHPLPVLDTLKLTSTLGTRELATCNWYPQIRPRRNILFWWDDVATDR